MKKRKSLSPWLSQLIGALEDLSPWPSQLIEGLYEEITLLLALPQTLNTDNESVQQQILYNHPLNKHYITRYDALR